jgi:hypothetical protein
LTLKKLTAILVLDELREHSLLGQYCDRIVANILWEDFVSCEQCFVLTRPRPETAGLIVNNIGDMLDAPATSCFGASPVFGKQEYNGNMIFDRSTSLSDIATGPSCCQPQAL